MSRRKWRDRLAERTFRYAYFRAGRRRTVAFTLAPLVLAAAGIILLAVRGC